jgi:hypothetical protein
MDASWSGLADKMIDSIDPRLIGTGLRIIGSSKDRTKLPILEKGLENKDEEVRREAGRHRESFLRKKRLPMSFGAEKGTGTWRSEPRRLRSGQCAGGTAP